MHIRLPHHNETRFVPRSLQEYLISRFHLSPEYVKELRCFIYKGMVGIKTVRRVSIFSPMAADENKIIIKTFRDLKNNPSIILFEGHIDKQGNPYAADRRVSNKIYKKGRSEK